MPDSKKRVLVLGAGASRAVSYATRATSLSPLDNDFFDLLQRHEVKSGKSEKQKDAINRVLSRVKKMPPECWRSMERAFYMLHLRAYLAGKLGLSRYDDTDEAVVAEFATSIQALLRAAHGKRTCTFHQRLLRTLTDNDAILTFNYDLVTERALRKNSENRNLTFGRWLYGLGESEQPPAGPVLLKLHGSSNWRLTNDGQPEFHVLTKHWSDFDDTPGYRGDSGEGTVFPIFLPFWDKRIEEDPWLDIWKTAFKQLSLATEIVVWGYSLPPTDIKAEHLFTLARTDNAQFKLCVIDPAQGTRQRWRDLFRDAKFWQYSNVTDFIKHPPSWW